MKADAVECCCPHCNQQLDAPAEMVGTTEECPCCHKRFIVHESLPATRLTPPLQRCPYCNNQIARDAVLCIYCGTNLKTGKKLDTLQEMDNGGMKSFSVFRGTGSERTINWGFKEILVPLLLCAMYFIYSEWSTISKKVMPPVESARFIAQKSETNREAAGVDEQTSSKQHEFDNARFPVSLNGNWGYINTKGRLVILRLGKHWDHMGKFGWGIRSGVRNLTDMLEIQSSKTNRLM